MATIALAAVGAAIGAAALPTSLTLAGAAISGAAIGKAIGGLAGSYIDQRLFGGGSQVKEGHRVTDLKLQTSRQGASIPVVFGSMRVGGQVIWAARFKERRHVTEVSGGKGGGGGSTKSSHYTYSLSFAIALAEGEVVRMGRVWADGKPLDLSKLTYRFHSGAPNQPADPLIVQLEGQANAPAFRNTAYILFEDMELADFGNRIPQLNVEVFRRPASSASDIDSLIKGVSLIPGSGESALSTTTVLHTAGNAEWGGENQHAAGGEADITTSLDHLEAALPEARSVSLVASWFGDDLRASHCALKPGIEHRDKQTRPFEWRVNDVSRQQAYLVSRDGSGAPSFGGTPSDISIIEAIQECRRRGLKVMFYPFILMDISPGNTLRDPWSGAETQPYFPWRGRITLSSAPPQADTPDKTSAAADEVASFFGEAGPEDFSPRGQTIVYLGPAEWSLRRMVLHYAHLCKLAGGVDAFCISSELRGLTQIRSSESHYPAVEALQQLAVDVRSILGAQTKISYAADWSEYFGHQPSDSSGDVYFHLDPLWAHEDINFIGIDNYLPLSDLRPGDSAPSLSELQAQIEGGEGYDWYYASSADLAAQNRTPITDTAYAEDWVFRPKDIRNWWHNPHHNRPGGVRETASTAWVPGSKPIWFTEYGCPAVDFGSNQPNVFYDPKSAESALPYFSSGRRDDWAQRQYLRAVAGYWSSPEQHSQMVDPENCYAWTWDARPYPDFPYRTDVWSDAPNYRLGHWLNGRAEQVPLADIVCEICQKSGLTDIKTSGLRGLVSGFLLEHTQSAREALQGLMLAYSFDAYESGGKIIFLMRDQATPIHLSSASLVTSEKEEGDDFQLTREQETDLPETVRLSYLRADGAYQHGAAQSSAVDGFTDRVDSTSLPVTLRTDEAQSIADRILHENWVARETLTLRLPLSSLAVQPGDLISLQNVEGTYRITRQEFDGALALEAQRSDLSLHAQGHYEEDLPNLPTPNLSVPILADIFELPLLNGEETPHAPYIAAYASPWNPAAVYRSADEVDFALDTIAERAAIIGYSVNELPASQPGLWSGRPLRVRLLSGALLARERLPVLNGANTAALWAPEGEYEVIQFQSAQIAAEGDWILSGILRGQAGTENLVVERLAPGARFIFLDGAPTQLETPLNILGLERNYRHGPRRESYDHATYDSSTYTVKGIGLRPYAPVHLEASRGPEGDLHVSWVRRSRISGDSWGEHEIPLGEESERYRLRLVDASGAQIAEHFCTAPEIALSADETTTAREIRVAQISALVGAGTERSLVL